MATAKRARSFPEAFEVKYQQNTIERNFNAGDQFKKFKDIVRQEKMMEDQQWWSKLPFKMGYVILFLTVAIFFFSGAQEVNEKQQKDIKSQEEDSQKCLLKYQSAKCQLESPTQQCRQYLSCMKKIPKTSNYFASLMSTTIKKMTGDLIGPVMICVVGLLIKLIQTLSVRDLAKINKQ